MLKQFKAFIREFGNATEAIIKLIDSDLVSEESLTPLKSAKNSI